MINSGVYYNFVNLIVYDLHAQAVHSKEKLAKIKNKGQGRG